MRPTNRASPTAASGATSVLSCSIARPGSNTRCRHRVAPSIAISRSTSPHCEGVLGSRKREDTMTRLLIAVALAAIVAGLSNANAQTYPARPITMIVPLAPGGSTDVIGRIMAEGMRASLGQPVVVENVTGAGGTIGIGRLARATPDGY